MFYPLWKPAVEAVLIVGINCTHCGLYPKYFAQGVNNSLVFQRLFTTIVHSAYIKLMALYKEINKLFTLSTSTITTITKLSKKDIINTTVLWKERERGMLL